MNLIMSIFICKLLVSQRMPAPLRGIYNPSEVNFLSKMYRVRVLQLSVSVFPDKSIQRAGHWENSHEAQKFELQFPDIL